MTRDEELQQQAMSLIGFSKEVSRDDAIKLAYYYGAKYADATMLDRACEWLGNRHNIEKCLGILTSKTEDLVKSFRQAMEGGAE